LALKLIDRSQVAVLRGFNDGFNDNLQVRPAE